MKNNLKLIKFNKNLKKCLSDIINKKLFICDNIVTVVYINTNLSFTQSKVFISSLKDITQIIKLLNSSSKKIEHFLVNEFYFTKCPKISFLQCFIK